MIYSLSGTLAAKAQHFAIIEVGGMGFKVYMAPNALQSLPQIGTHIKVFSSFYGRDDGIFELFGFKNEAELALFEKLNSVAGVGPKTALGVLSVASADQIIVAIQAGKSDLLTRVSGIGKKTAERIVLELKGKLEKMAPVTSAQKLGLMESDIELEETLLALGYTRAQAKEAINRIDPARTEFKERLKEALKQAKS